MAVYKRDGRWVIKGTLKRADGTSYSYTKIAHGCKKEKEAIAYEVAFRDKCESEEKKKKAKTFREVAEDMLNESSIKDTTKRANTIQLRRAYPFIGSKRIDRITSEYLQTMFNKFSADLSYGTVANNKAVVGKVFKYAIKKRYIKDNPVAYVTIRKDKDAVKKELSFWEPEQFEEFITTVDDAEMRNYFTFLFWMGTRSGEASALQWKDIDFDARSVRIYKTFAHISASEYRITSPKTQNSIRSITMPDIVFRAVRGIYERQKSMYKFSDERYVFGYYKPLNNKMAYSRFMKYQKGLDVPQINLHGLRHSHVSYLINNMSDRFTVYDIAKRIGDNVNTVLSTYAHWFKNADRKLVEVIDQQAGAEDSGAGLSQLIDLKKALDMGLITSADYDAKKRQILGI